MTDPVSDTPRDSSLDWPRDAAPETAPDTAPHTPAGTAGGDRVKADAGAPADPGSPSDPVSAPTGAPSSEPDSDRPDDAADLGAGTEMGSGTETGSGTDSTLDPTADPGLAVDPGEESTVDPPTHEPVLSPPLLTLAQAVQVTGRSKNTIKARKDKLIEAGTTIDASGWSIPYPALIQVGLLDSVTTPDAPAPAGVERSSTNVSGRADTGSAGVRSGVNAGVTTGVNAATDPGHGVSDDEVARLREQISELRHRVALAEAIAAERDRVIDVQNRALRMLEVGTSTPSAPAHQPAPNAGSTSASTLGPAAGGSTAPAPVKKRRWFSRSQ